jgi:aspartate ammonia-lyase
MQSQLPMMSYSNALRATALELTRIVNDLRLLSSGPANGLGEIRLPSAQPGSSIMPGKVNPSILEMANQVLFKVLGNDAAMAFAMQAGQLELNVMMPLMAQLALESTHIMTNALRVLRTKTVEGIEADAARCRGYAERTSQIATALNPVLGYARAGEVAKEAVRTGRTILEVVRARKLLSEAQIRDLLDPLKLTEPA